MISSGSNSKFASLYRRVLAPLAVAALGLCAQSASALVYYSLDDGTAETGVGVGGSQGGDAIFLNQFPVAPGGQTISSISVVFGDPTDPTNTALLGLPYTVVLYSDPNGDGNPTDGTLLAFAGGVITNVNTNTFLTTNITSTNVTTPDFFVGFEIQNQPANTFPAGIDTTAPSYANRSWVTYGLPGTINAFNLGANQVPPTPIEQVINPGFTTPVGNWLIRANLPVPEPSTWVFVAASLAGLGLVTRRVRA